MDKSQAKKYLALYNLSMEEAKLTLLLRSLERKLPSSNASGFYDGLEVAMKVLGAK